MSKGRGWRCGIFCLSVAALAMVLGSCGRETETGHEPSGINRKESAIQKSKKTEQSETGKVETVMEKFDFSEFENVDITGIDMDTLETEQKEVLYCRAKYCEAMTETDTDTMRELMAEYLTLTHMSGRQQTREEYLADVESEELRYYHIGIENPVIEVSGNQAVLTAASVLTADAYGAEGTFHMEGTSYYEKRGGNWIMVNNPQ